VGLAGLDRGDGGAAVALRRDEIGLADAQRDDAVEVGDELEEVAYSGRRNRINPVRKSPIRLLSCAFRHESPP